MEDGTEHWKEDVREKSNDIEEVILEECVDGTVSEDDLKHDDNESDDEDGSVEMKLCDWVEFCLNEQMVFHNSGIINETHLHIGCRFTERLLLMRPRQLASALIQRRLMHRLLDLICSNKLSNSMRCQATNTLFASLFYWDELPIYVVLRLRSIIDYCAFMYWLFLIRNLSTPQAYRESDTEHSIKLLESLTKTINFITEWPKTKTNPKCFMYRSLHDSEILRSLCLIVTSTKMRVDIRQCAVRLLKILIDYDGKNITGAVFLAHTRIEVANLVLRILDLCSNDDPKHDSDQVNFFSELQSKKGLLPYALHALQLINNLALTNQRYDVAFAMNLSDELDCEERILVLQQMLMFCVTSNGLKALTCALSYASSMEYLLEVFTLSTDSINASDEAKVRMRQSASYGYACEILFTLARSQSNGSFWRTYGGFLCRLIDSSFISAYLCNFTEAVDRSTALHAIACVECECTSFFTSKKCLIIIIIFCRLTSYTNKFASGEPPFSVITVLRLINTILDEHYDDLKANQSERYYEIVTIFYDEGGLQQVIQLLKLANTMYSRSTTESRSSLKGDPSIYVSLVCSALHLIDKLHKSFISISKLLDVSAVDVMVDTYALCGFGKTADHLRIRRLILANLAVFVTTTQASLSVTVYFKFHFVAIWIDVAKSHNPLKIALDRLLHYGMSQPQTFLAVIDIVRRLIPQPYIDAAECDELGISSSCLLRSHLIALLIRLAHLGVDMARFIAETLLEQIISALSISSTSSILKALENESDDLQLKSLINEEVRFGAATDYTTAAMIAFTFQCLHDKSICASFVDVLSKRSLFITTSLKFYNVASPKTVSHVIFQKYLIVERAFASKSGSLTTFIRRFESIHSSDLLNTVGELLLKLFENCFSKYKTICLSNAWLCVALRWPLAADEHNGDNCKEHPLSRFTMHLQQKSDYGCPSSSVLSRLEDIIKILEKSSETSETEKEFTEEEAWSAADNIAQQIERITTTLCDTDFDPPMMAVDVKQIAQEFFSEGFLDQEIPGFPPFSIVQEQQRRGRVAVSFHFKGQLLYVCYVADLLRGRADIPSSACSKTPSNEDQYMLRFNYGDSMWA
ncbi:unnamed protein product [Anisakis simplex]|uniref:BTB domain-containing protein n=1 Tax=Anisakis simplex TaxID=6269 RepID=A0A158PMZ0_ANISI|nr:unnamed protein product [Anisakis simplex]